MKVTDKKAVNSLLDEHSSFVVTAYQAIGRDSLDSRQVVIDRLHDQPQATGFRWGTEYGLCIRKLDHG